MSIYTLVLWMSERRNVRIFKANFRLNRLKRKFKIYSCFSQKVPFDCRLKEWM